MSLEIRVEGVAAFHRVAAQIRAEGSKDLSKRMAAGLATAVEPIEKAIRAEAVATMPSSGGYASLLSKSLRFRKASRAAAQTASYRLITYADGTRQRRDIVALNRGSLRHPVFGRSRRLTVGPRAGTLRANTWAVTHIRPGFHDRGTESAMDAAHRQMAIVLDELAARLVK